ncbi:hypothetical protein BKA70DRAFT_1459233 [Coprinopsis sp. MPI-PUGE-AT-0042]|nr:hypothetical protein BKA70DRAFT_1459233 [Coprinopsis sp. MPI-PUGE-AT-0042]
MSYGTGMDIELYHSCGQASTNDNVEARVADSRNANSESEIHESMLNAGLLIYPVLQAADILAYRATHVPVGKDQTQHPEPCLIIQQVNRAGKEARLPPRQPSSSDPSSKMSKSSPNVNSRILLTDSLEKIASKIRSSVTDSIKGITYDPAERPGISNLLTVLSACLGETPADVAVVYASKTNAELKADVEDAVETLFQGPRAEFERLRNERGCLEQVAKDGADRAKALSEETMKQVRSMVGLG